MSDKKKTEKSPKSDKLEKVLTEAEKAERAREEAAAEARKIAEATLSRYVSWVENLKGRHAFRGQANAAWRLQSSAYRRLLNKKIKHPEVAGYLFAGYLYERVNETMMRFSAHGGQQPLEVMARMQHHGAATGLIDFTESALAALWFACKDEQDKPGKVVAVRLDDGEKIQEIKKPKDIEGSLEKFFPVEPDKQLWAWRPGDGDSRMVTQQSLFIFGRPDIGEEFINDEFSVLTEEKGRYMEILGRMGISENFIFSDFSGFSAANAFGKDYALHLAGIYYAEKIKEDPKNASYHFQKGIFNVTQSAYKEAIEDFTHAIEINPQYAVAYYNRGNALGEWVVMRRRLWITLAPLNSVRRMRKRIIIAGLLWTIWVVIRRHLRITLAPLNSIRSMRVRIIIAGLLWAIWVVMRRHLRITLAPLNSIRRMRRRMVTAGTFIHSGLL